MHIYKKLSVWRKAHELVLRVYAATGPMYDRNFGSLAGQMRRAATSVPANIAEGSGRATSAQFANFLQLAIGSTRELDYHLLLARDLALLSSSDHATLEARADEVCKMLVALRKTVAARPPSPKRPAARPTPTPTPTPRKPPPQKQEDENPKG